MPEIDGNNYEGYLRLMLCSNKLRFVIMTMSSNMIENTLIFQSLLFTGFISHSHLSRSELYFTIEAIYAFIPPTLKQLTHLR